MTRCGTIALIGRPNVGKSTLLNRLVGQKLSITARRPQTTRGRLQGVLSREQSQFIFVDTPGYQTQHLNALHRAMNRCVQGTVQEVDGVVLVSEALHWSARDQQVLAQVPASAPLFLVINKVDRVHPKNALLPFLQSMSERAPWQGIFPLSARHDGEFAALLAALEPLLPLRPFEFDPDTVTDSSTRFLVAEFVREQLFRQLGEELPYATTVVIEQYQESATLHRIFAAIWVDGPQHKAIVIGQGGARLKQIGSRARLQIERLVQCKVYLELWVKVKGGWADDAHVLRQLGLDG